MYHNVDVYHHNNNENRTFFVDVDFASIMNHQKGLDSYSPPGPAQFCKKMNFLQTRIKLKMATVDEDWFECKENYQPVRGGRNPKTFGGCSSSDVIEKERFGSLFSNAPDYDQNVQGAVCCN